MSVIGPRPQLVRDMVFMTPEQRLRHIVRPGLSGLAQTRGRNALSWDVILSSSFREGHWSDTDIQFATARVLLPKEWDEEMPMAYY